MTLHATKPVPEAKDESLYRWTELGASAVNAVVAAGHVKSLMVISAASGEGRTTASATLGWACSRLGPTLLVDAHSDKGALSRSFGQPNAPGLAEVLAGEIDLLSAARPTAVENLHILPCGARPVDPRAAFAMFQGEAFAEALRRLRQDYDRIVCDTPPFLEDPAAAALSARFDAAVMVLTCNQTRWEVARMVQERLEAAGGRLLGAVLNRRQYPIPAAIYRAL